MVKSWVIVTKSKMLKLYWGLQTAQLGKRVASSSVDSDEAAHKAPHRATATMINERQIRIITKQKWAVEEISDTEQM